MTEAGKMSLREKIKLEAQNEVQKEVFNKAKEKLVELYRKQEAAKKVLKNIESEIADYEMEISE